MHWAWGLWPYALAAAAAVFWLAIRWRRIDRRLQFLLVAFVAGLLANLIVDQACLYLVPVDVAGTPPPDPRNVRLRLQITAAVQVPVSILVAGLVALALRRRLAI